MPFDYTSGNPDNLAGGGPARMQDIQGPFYDLRAYLNSAVGRRRRRRHLGAGRQRPVLDVGALNQRRAGRQLAPAQFTALGLSVPLGLWNLGDLTDISGNGRVLSNKGAVTFGAGINGLATTAAVFSARPGRRSTSPTPARPTRSASRRARGAAGSARPSVARGRTC
jgi:hypothetical protein